MTAEGSIAGLPFAVASTEVHTVGAGGGSVAWMDAGGSLRVGPRSAGADPGPACYGRGGNEPTVTDAYVALGELYRASQLKSRAQAMYRKAVQAQPGHQEALAELAALDGEGPPEGGTRLKKFFSKS